MAKLTHNTCQHCGLPVLGGWTGTGELLSELVTVDAWPLTPEQELAALAAGCRTFTLHHVPGQLHPRTAWAIRCRPAGTRPRQTVHPLHWCTRTPGGHGP